MTATQEQFTAEDTGHAATALAKIASSVAGMDLRTIATVLVRSGYFQDTREIAQAVVKVLAGTELGFGPIASMQGVYIVKGRVTLAANLVAAAIQRSGRFRYRVTKLDRTGCSMKFYERWDGHWQEIGESTFDGQDATAAGLAGGDNYKHFPRNMYFARALTNGARWYCPEIFNGPVYTPDEMGARVDDDGQVIEIPPAPPVDTTTGEVLENRSADMPAAKSQGRTEATPPASVRRPSRADVWQRNRELCNRAAQLGLQGVRIVPQQSGEDVVAEANEDLAGRIRAWEAGSEAQPEL